MRRYTAADVAAVRPDPLQVALDTRFTKLDLSVRCAVAPVPACRLLLVPVPRPVDGARPRDRPVARAARTYACGVIA